MTSTHEKIDGLSLDLFDHIESQTTPNDRRSLLAVQSVMRHRLGRPYVYLEIGSHLGGSLQPLVVDPDCSRIISIDPRPTVFRDERGLDLTYGENSTARMLKLLGKLPGGDIGKIVTIESGTDRLDPRAIVSHPDYCLIDGEHTDAAALNDARFCLKVVNPDGCLLFHDANIIYRALDRFLGELEHGGLRFRAYILPDAVFVIELGACDMMDAEPIRTLFRNNHQAYLFGLRSTEWYREVLNQPLFKRLRKTRFVRRLFVVPGVREQGV